MPFWKAGKNDDQVLDELKETQKQNADEFVKKQEHADEAQKSSLIIDNNFTPVEYDPQYILQVNHLKKYFPIKAVWCRRRSAMSRPSTASRSI